MFTYYRSYIYSYGKILAISDYNDAAYLDQCYKEGCHYMIRFGLNYDDEKGTLT